MTQFERGVEGVVYAPLVATAFTVLLLLSKFFPRIRTALWQEEIGRCVDSDIVIVVP